MRPLKWIDVTDSTLQRCLLLLDERCALLGIEEEDVISVDSVFNEHAKELSGSVTAFLYYWQPRKP